MPTLSAQERRVEKINKTRQAILDNKWRSVNEFLIAFYSSNDPAVVHHSARSLAYEEGKSFLPREMLNLWQTRCKSKPQFNQIVAEKAAEIVVQESTRALRRPELHLDTADFDLDVSTNFGLSPLQKIYQTTLPCLFTILVALLTAKNEYEHRRRTVKLGKEDMAFRITVVIISMLLFARNRATNAFQLIMGIFLSSCGASQRVIDSFNHMGLCVSYRTTDRALVSLTRHATKKARLFVRLSSGLYGVVYDNINFTLRKVSQRLDSSTQQINATTIAVFSLPKRFTRAAYAQALDLAARNQRAGQRDLFTEDDLHLTKDQHSKLREAMKHHVRSILVKYAPGLRGKTRRAFRKKVKGLKPHIRVLEHEKTQFFPLPALDQEEASVHGTIKVVQRIWRDLLGLAVEIIDTEIRLMVGDWLTIRNLRLMKKEREDEFSGLERMAWVQEAAMPFHFQLNAMYMLCRTHIGHPNDHDPASLEKHRTLLRRSKLDPKKPEYNKARELVFHSLIARILDCARVLLKKEKHTDMKSWKPTWEDFDKLVDELVDQFATSKSALRALELGDDVLAHSILFIRDALTFWEFSDAVRDADVGRMWIIYDFWVFMMRGAGCHNYGNEILEMKAQFQHEMSPLLREVVERTWLVNRWGKKGRSIPTDLYLEHNNGFEKNMFAAKGSSASVEDVKNKSSACVEILREIAHSTTKFLGVRDHHRGRTEVRVESDIDALCLDLKAAGVHHLTSNRHIPPPKTRSKTNPKNAKKGLTTGVKDILRDGMLMLGQKNMFAQWKSRSASGGADLYGGDKDALDRDTGFDEPEGRLDVDTTADPEFADKAMEAGGDAMDDLD